MNRVAKHLFSDPGLNPQSTPCCGISPRLPMLRGLRATLA